ncbi:hypothetical protein CSC2_31660 [Clostridium zeae]|uniref:HipA-like C-terminal domain-containing protein n=1 Tax=Clostridium zeae TaxID=2759022 RepID=A0ABQ1EDC6_9CLOT|nr:hypothetical protein [Clostridium zeae]GFZ32640.1 hypothetical protein CSC2_31660 [Clostridium zeae]
MSKIELANIVNKYSKNDDYDFDGYLMYKDVKVAEIKNTELIKSLEDNLLPVIMINKNSGTFEAWLQTRVIDTHRTNSRQVRRRLSIRTEVSKEIVIKSRAMSITDNYWLKWLDEDISYKEVRDKLSDGLNTVALYGNPEEIIFSETDISPELTNIGSFEKCWKLIDGSWYMIKKGTLKENFAEILTANIAISLGFDAVEYKAIDEGALVMCKDFTNNAEVDFEPMFSFVKDYWEVDASVEIINELGYIKEFLDITFMDALCYNIDRHTFNFGLLRKDGEPIGLAPNFDNNLALSGVLNDKGLEKTWFSTSFTRNNYKPILRSYNYSIPKIDFENIKSIVKATAKDFKILSQDMDFQDIVFKIIKNNYDELIK